MAKTRSARPSKKSLGLVNRALFWHNAKRTWCYHGAGANQAHVRLKARALRARRLLLAHIAKLESEGIAARDMLRRARR